MKHRRTRSQGKALEGNAPRLASRAGWALPSRPGRACRCAGFLVAAGLQVGAQETVPPWITAAPGLEHPAAWGMEPRPWTFAVQRQTRWNGSDPQAAGSWLGAGWCPGSGSAVSRGNAGDWGFGLVVQDDPLATGWRGQTVEASAATSTLIDRQWRATAAWSLGATRWTLDPATWSWDAQYGPAGFDPSLPTGEAASMATGSTRVEAALSMGLASAAPSAAHSRAAGQGTRGALTVRHAFKGRMPHLDPERADTLGWRWSWWMEQGGRLPGGRTDWKGWHRGSLQAGHHLLEVGMTIGRAFGTTARYTKMSMSHHLSTGLILRSDGLVRLAFRWERDGVHLMTGPGWTWGPLWRPPPGWTVSIGWTPDPGGGVSIVR